MEAECQQQALACCTLLSVLRALDPVRAAAVHDGIRGRTRTINGVAGSAAGPAVSAIGVIVDVIGCLPGVSCLTPGATLATVAAVHITIILMALSAVAAMAIAAENCHRFRWRRKGIIIAGFRLAVQAAAGVIVALTTATATTAFTPRRHSEVGLTMTTTAAAAAAAEV